MLYCADGPRIENLCKERNTGQNSLLEFTQSILNEKKEVISKLRSEKTQINNQLITCETKLELQEKMCKEQQGKLEGQNIILSKLENEKNQINGQLESCRTEQTELQDKQSNLREGFKKKKKINGIFHLGI